MDAIGKLTRLSTILALLLAILISIVLPAGYCYLGYQNQRAIIATEAEMISILISQAIGSSPDYWQYEERRLAEILARHTAKEFAEERRIVAANSSVIAQSGGKIAPPLLTVTHDLFDSGDVVGQIEITTSLRPLLMQTIVVGIISTLFGLAIFVILKSFPLRALDRALHSVYEEKERALAILNNIPDIAWLKDKESRYIAANEPYARLCGVPVAEIPGKSDFDLWPEELAELYRAGDQEVVITGKTLEREESTIDAAGKTTWIVKSKTPIYNDQGEVIGTTGIGRDITERKRTEEEILRLNAKLEAKVEERTKQLLDAQEELVRREKLSILGQLSGSVGHELRNPLGVMSNAIYFLKMVNSDETTLEYLDIIKQEIDNSLRIITDLLDFARTNPPQTRAVSVRQLLDESLKNCTIPESVDLQIDLPESLPLLKVDPLQLGQVFSNLITNAIQAMPDGGVVLITARRVRAIPESPLHNPKDGTGDFVAISVEDNGEGITPENMKKLFQPLFTTKVKGIGLGLVVCKNLVEANGGKIEVKSESGTGTTFMILLPVGA